MSRVSSEGKSVLDSFCRFEDVLGALNGWNNPVGKHKQGFGDGFTVSFTVDISSARDRNWICKPILAGDVIEFDGILAREGTSDA